MLKCEFFGRKKQFIFVNRVIESHSRPYRKIKKNIIRVKFSFKFCRIGIKQLSGCVILNLGYHFNLVSLSHNVSRIK